MVTVYTKPSCGQCLATKRWLEKEGVEFELVHLDKDPEALEYVKSLGYLGAPVVTLAKDGEVVDHWSGFSEKKIKSLKS